MAAVIEDIEKLRLQLVDVTAAVESSADGDLAELVSGVQRLRRWHHTYLHSQHWTVELDHNQRPIFRKPDGTTHRLTARAPTRAGPSGEPCTTN